MRLLVLDNQKQYIVFEDSDHGVPLSGYNQGPDYSKEHLERQSKHSQASHLSSKPFKRLTPTHFVAIKLDWVDKNCSENAYADLSRSSKSFNGLFTEFERLHLTITALVLDTDEKVALAHSIMYSIVEKRTSDGFLLSIDEPENPKYPTVTVEGLCVMKGTPSHCQVLYAKIHSKNLDFLLSFCESVKSAFQQAGLDVDDHGPIKLHCTVMNTRYMSNTKNKISKGMHDKRNQTFDATHIINQGLDLGGARLSMLHLSPLISDPLSKVKNIKSGDGKYYRCDLSLYISTTDNKT